MVIKTEENYSSNLLFIKGLVCSINKCISSSSLMAQQYTIANNNRFGETPAQGPKH